MSAEHKCATCAGRGQVTQRQRVGETDFEEWGEDCPVCNGAGHAPEHVQNHIAFLNTRIKALQQEAHQWWSAAAGALSTQPQAPQGAVTPCADISYPDTLEKVLVRLAAGSWDSTLIKEAEKHLHTLAGSAGLAREYMDWIDCYHSGGDYTDFITKRFPAAPETPEGKK